MHAPAPGSGFARQRMSSQRATKSYPRRPAARILHEHTPYTKIRAYGAARCRLNEKWWAAAAMNHWQVQLQPIEWEPHVLASAHLSRRFVSRLPPHSLFFSLLAVIFLTWLCSLPALLAL